MKTKLLLLILLFSIPLLSQEKYDVRKAKWGMTISEVKASEYPLVGEDHDGAATKLFEFDICYYDVTIGNDHKASIIYSFTNKRLTEISYQMYGRNDPDRKGTDSHFIPLLKKIEYTNFVFDALQKDKHMTCSHGWCDPFSSKLNIPANFHTCGTDAQTVEYIEKAGDLAHITTLSIGFENERSYATFYFNQYQNADKTNNLIAASLNSNYYNQYYTLRFTPSYLVKQGLIKNDF